MSVNQVINELVRGRPAQPAARRPSAQTDTVFQRQLEQSRETAERTATAPTRSSAVERFSGAELQDKADRSASSRPAERRERAETFQKTKQPARETSVKDPSETADTQPDVGSRPTTEDSAKAESKAGERSADGSESATAKSTEPGADGATAPPEPAAAITATPSPALQGDLLSSAILSLEGDAGLIDPNGATLTGSATAVPQVAGQPGETAPASQASVSITVPGQGATGQTVTATDDIAAPGGSDTAPSTVSATAQGAVDIVAAKGDRSGTATTEQGAAPDVAEEAATQTSGTNAGQSAKAETAATVQPSAQQGGSASLQTTQAVSGLQVASPQTAASPTASVSTTPAQTAQSQAENPVPLQAVAVEIGMRAMRGAKEFQIRLDPEDLGRIDVRLEIGEAGEVQAKLVVERVETLQLLQRDARTLERAFDQAGLKTNPDGLQFSLRDPGQQTSGEGRGQRDGETAVRTGQGQSEPTPEERSLINAIYRAPAAGGLDIRI